MGRILVYTTLGCSYCAQVKAILHQHEVVWYEVRVDKEEQRIEELAAQTGSIEVPAIFLNEHYLGGVQELRTALEKDPMMLHKVLQEESPSFPVLPEDSRREIGDRVTHRLMASRSEREVLHLDKIVSHLREAAVTNDFRMKPKDFRGLSRSVLCFKGIHLTAWMKKTYPEENAARVCLEMLRLRFIEAANGTHKTRFDARSHYTFFFPSVNALNAHLKCDAKEDAQEDAVALSHHLRQLSADILDSYVNTEGVWSIEAIRSSKYMYNFYVSCLRLQLCDTRRLSAEAQKVFFINLYHTLFFHQTVDGGVPRNQEERRRFFQEKGYLVGQSLFTLDSIDYIRMHKGIALSSPKEGDPWARRIGDPRVHFALQTMRPSSPPLMVYTPENVDRALDMATALFLDREVKFPGGSVVVPKLFSLYSSEFGADQREVIEWLARFHPRIAETLKEHPEQLKKLSYTGHVMLSASTSSDATKFVGDRSSGVHNERDLRRAARSLTGTGRGLPPMSPRNSDTVVLDVDFEGRLFQVEPHMNDTVFDLKVMIHNIVVPHTLPYSQVLVFEERLLDLNTKTLMEALASSQPRPGNAPRRIQMRVSPADPQRSYGVRRPNPEFCFATGRALSHSLGNTPSRFRVFLGDSNAAFIPATAGHTKQLSVAIRQGGVDVATNVVVQDGYIVVAFALPSDREDYSVTLKFADQPLKGSPWRGQVLAASFPAETIVQQCESPDWTPELIRLLSLVEEPWTVIGAYPITALIHRARPSDMQTMTRLMSQRLRADPKNQELLFGELGLGALGFLHKLTMYAPYDDSDAQTLREVLVRILITLLSQDWTPEEDIQEILLPAAIGMLCGPRPLLGAVLLRDLAEYDQLSAVDFSSPLLVTGCCAGLGNRDDEVVSLTLVAMGLICDRDPSAIRPNSELAHSIVKLAATRNLKMAIRVFRVLEALLVHGARFETMLREAGIAGVLVNCLRRMQDSIVCKWESRLLNSAVFSSAVSVMFPLSATRGRSDTTGEYIAQLLTFIAGLLQLGDDPYSLLLDHILNCTQASDERILLLLWTVAVGVAAKVEFPPERFFTLLSRFLHSCVREERLDFLGVPVQRLLSESCSASTQHSAMVMFDELLTDRQLSAHRSPLLQSLGSEFLRCYVSEVAAGTYSPTDFQINAADIKQGDLVGAGVAGQVYRGTWRNQTVAIKRVEENTLAFSLREFLSELALMNILRHPNVAHLLGGSAVPGHLFLVSKFYSRGALDTVLNDERIELTASRRLSFLMQAARGMKYLHSLGVIHRDLKPGNLLVDEQWNVAVCDFGVSRMINQMQMTRGVGTPLFMAPEVLEGTDYAASADVYSFSMVIYHVVTRQEPFADEHNMMNLIPRIVGGERPVPPKGSPFSAMIQRCWSVVPEKRPTFAHIVEELEDMSREHERQNQPGSPFARRRESLKSNSMRKSLSQIIEDDEDKLRDSQKKRLIY